MLRKTRVGILTFSDGRDFLQQPLEAVNRKFLEALSHKLTKAGFEVIPGREVVWTNQLAVQEGKYLRSRDVDVTIFNYSVWAFPQFTAMAAQFVPKPLLLFSNVNPQYPGLVALLAASGALEETGVPFKRLFGDMEDKAVMAQITRFVNAAAVPNKLRGETYGLFGGRSIGIYTAVSNTDQWMAQFGIDVEQVDQLEVIRGAEAVDAKKVEQALKWCERHVKKIHYDGKQLTPEKLKLQIRMYYAMKRLIEERGFDFSGIKSQTELTNHYATTDVPEAFLNDPYDFDGPKEPHVCATEADMDAALTMEMFKHLTGTPVLFADIRHYFEDLKLFDLVNSGQHATYFAAKSLKPEDNLKHVEFKPEGFYFPAGGASVYHIAAPGAVTLARLMRKSGKYWMAITSGKFVSFGAAKDHKLAAKVQDNWPHAFAKLDGDPQAFLATMSCNHIHGVYGDYVEELKTICWATGIEPVVLGR